MYWLDFDPSAVVALHVFQSSSVQKRTLGYLARSSGGGGFLLKRGPAMSMAKGFNATPIGPSATDVAELEFCTAKWETRVLYAFL